MEKNNLIDFIAYRNLQESQAMTQDTAPEDLATAIQLLIQHLREMKSG
jgi:hypothetical protein